MKAWSSVNHSILSGGKPSAILINLEIATTTGEQIIGDYCVAVLSLCTRHTKKRANAIQKQRGCKKY
jgi:hypothetical protein